MLFRSTYQCSLRSIRSGVLISPAGRLADDAILDFFGQLEEPRGRPIALGMRGIPVGIVGIDVQRAAVEEMLVHAIGEHRSKFGNGLQHMRRVRRRLSRHGAIRVDVGVQSQDPFRVPRVKLEARALRPAAARDVVVVPGPVRVAGIDVDDHVVDQIVDIQVILEGGVVAAVGIVALQPLPGGDARRVSSVASRTAVASESIVFQAVRSPSIASPALIESHSSFSPPK